MTQPNDKIKPKFLVKTNYLGHYSLRLLMGNFFLSIPAICVMAAMLIGGNVEYLLVLPVSSCIGVVLIYPTLSTITSSPKEKVAIDALKIGFFLMAGALCLIQTPLTTRSTKETTPPFKEQLPLPL